MFLKLQTITFDCPDPYALAHWWASAIGGDVNDVAAGEYVLLGRSDGPALGFQRVANPTPGKNKLHLDFHSSDVEAEVARLVGLGATETGRHTFGDDFHWVVLTDPDGNAFCVAQAG